MNHDEVNRALVLPRFDVSREAHDLIERIADRALVMSRKVTQRKPSFSKMEIMMDVTAVHANGTPLKLVELLETDDFNFCHDVFGIHRHIDRTNGSLGGCFVPRFVVPQ